MGYAIKIELHSTNKFSLTVKKMIDTQKFFFMKYFKEFYMHLLSEFFIYPTLVATITRCLFASSDTLSMLRRHNNGFSHYSVFHRFMIEYPVDVGKFRFLCLMAYQPSQAIWY